MPSNFENLLTEIENLTEAVQLGFTEIGKTESFDKEFNQNALAAMQKIMDAVLQMKQVNIDMTPISNVMSDISKQNKVMMENLGRLIHSADNTQLIKLVTETAKRSGDLIEVTMKKTNNLNGEELKLILASTKSGEIKEITVERDINNGLITRVIPHYKQQQ